jgi:hypothetical protein
MIDTRCDFRLAIPLDVWLMHGPRRCRCVLR